MVKGFRQIASLTAISRVFGLVRDIAFSHFFGAGNFMDAWVIAFRIPNLARRLFGEGAASASFIPIYSEQLQKDKKKAASLANTVVTVICLTLIAIIILGWTGMLTYKYLFAKNSETKLILSLSSTMLPYMLLVCIVAILAGILNVHRHFAAPAAAPIVLNIFIIAALVVSAKFLDMPSGKQVYFVAVAVLIAGLVQLAIQIPPLRASGVTIRPAWDIHSQALKKTLTLMLPMVLGLTVTQINTLADDVIAWCLSGSKEKGDFFTLFARQISYPLRRGSVSHLYFSQRLYQFPLGVLGISLATAIFPVMSENAAKHDLLALCKTVSKGIKGAFFIAFPATVGLILVAKPVVAVFLQHGLFEEENTRLTAFILAFYAIGLSAFFAQQLLVRAFFSIQDSKTPLKSALIAVGINIILNLTFVWFLGAAGLALSTAICSYLQVVILIKGLHARFPSHQHREALFAGLITDAAKTLIASFVMYLVGALIMGLTAKLPIQRTYQILRLAAVIPTAVLTYYLVAKALKIPALNLISTQKHQKM